MSNNKIIQGSFFEEDYLARSLGPVAHNYEVALTELVANCWDAGATIVDIIIPDERGKKLYIKDNGTGLTKEQFYSRWMRLRYNRLKHQGKVVEFPQGVKGQRMAYGRNGIGRHGLLCFNTEYKVITNCNGKQSIFTISTENKDDPFVIKSEQFRESNKTGTKLEVVVEKNLPNPQKILKILSARFLHDPTFKISINKKTVPLEKLEGLIDTTLIKINNDINLKAHFVDSSKSGRTTLYQGIAFWQSGRLVGEPSWSLGNKLIIDGRTSLAKRYTVVVKTNNLADYIKEDWTGFKKHSIIDQIYDELEFYCNQIFSNIAMENVEERKVKIRSEFKNDYKNLSPLSVFDINETIEDITKNHPTAKEETLSIAVQAIINLEKSKSGKNLLLKLAQLSEDDIDGMDELLEKWTVRDALTVLNEIHNRLSVIEAISKLSKDPEVDELHVLHPLVTAARWLFGPEFESAEYSFNRQLQTAVKEVLKKEVTKDSFNNHRKRPDLVVLPNSTLSITGTEIFDPESGLSSVNRLLLLELKKGGSKLGRTERNQAQGYVEDFMNCGSLIGNPHIESFVVGETITEKVAPLTTVKNEQNVEIGKVRITTFGQLVDTASVRLFGLQAKLNERYEDVPGMEMFKEQIKQGELKLN